MAAIRRASQRPYWKTKRALDFVAALCLSVLCAPLCLLLAVLIYLDDPHGSPLFCQTRLGLNEKPFTMYKFRTMVVDAETRLEKLAALNEMDGPVFKIEKDPRITRIGRFLRKCSLDELPQLINVLRGDLSLVGPRPPLPREVAEYSAYHRLRLLVKPGLTCYWQVCRERNKLSFEEWMEMDMEYILRACLWEDVKLFLRTPLVMLRGGGC